MILLGYIGGVALETGKPVFRSAPPAKLAVAVHGDCRSTQPGVDTLIPVDTGPIIPERDIDALSGFGDTQPEFAGVASNVGVLDAVCDQFVGDHTKGTTMWVER